MKSSEICNLAIQIVAWLYGEVQYRQNNTTYYPDMSWNLLTWYNNAWHADCLGLVRAVLCGWNANKNVVAGGADTSYACYNYNEIMMLNSCSYTSTNFVELANHPCSLLYKDGHVGIYLGEFQLNGLTYNSAECTTSFGWGGRPTWCDPDGQRKAHKDAGGSGSYWTHWGIFNLTGQDYGITEYDGGGTGATGFGSALTQEEVLQYWDTVGDPSYDYLVQLADTLYGMDSATFAIMAGWEYGEGYQVIDEYMGYLCACIPVNGYMGYNMQTPSSLASWIAGGDSSAYYSVAQMTARANQCRNDTSDFGKATRIALLLALLNPNQRVVFCNGVGSRPPENLLIYEIFLSGGQPIWAFASAYGDQTYDITGSGIRGGLPDPAGHTRKKLPVWMYLRPYYNYNQYRMLWR